MSDTVSIRYSSSYRPKPTTWSSASGRHLVIHGAFEDVDEVPKASIFFLDPPAIPEDCSIDEFTRWISMVVELTEKHRTEDCALLLAIQERKGHPFSKGAIAATVAQIRGWKLFRLFTWLSQEADFNRSSYAATPVYAFRKGNKPARAQSSIRYRDVVRIHGLFQPHEELVDPFPSDVSKTFISLFAAPADIVMDPFAGTGSTALGAIELGLRTISVELNPDRAKEIARKIAAAEKGSLA